MAPARAPFPRRGRHVAVFDCGRLAVAPSVYSLLREGVRYRIFSTLGPVMPLVARPAIDVVPQTPSPYR